MDNIWKAQSRSRLGDGAEVLAPDKEHWLHRGQIVDEYAEGQTLPPGYRVVELRSGKAFALPEARLVPWRGYPQRLLAGCQGSSKQTPDLPCAVWRCEIWTEGLFSLLFWALGWLETEAAAASQATNLLIDWTDPRILLHGGGERYANNAWNHFFEQPAGEGLPEGSLEAAEAHGRLKIVVRFGMPWFKKFGEFRGADEGNGDVQGIRGGRLNEAAASAGRVAMRRWIRVRPSIRQRVEAWCDAQNEDVARSLAVHIRRTDKLEQCRSNQWSEKELAMQIRTFCSSLALPCVFLCSDDVSLKGQLARQLGRDGLRVLSFEALLSSGGLPSHKDEKLDRRQNAEDVLVEVLIMSRCAALLSTYSNVSVAAIYFSEPGFPFFMFDDALPEGSRATPVASYGGFRRCGACSCGVIMARGMLILAFGCMCLWALSGRSFVSGPATQARQVNVAAAAEVKYETDMPAENGVYPVGNAKRTAPYGERDPLPEGYGIRTGLSDLLKPLNAEAGVVAKEDSIPTVLVMVTGIVLLFLFYLLLLLLDNQSVLLPPEDEFDEYVQNFLPYFFFGEK
eukprot:s4_g22.t1